MRGVVRSPFFRGSVFLQNAVFHLYIRRSLYASTRSIPKRQTPACQRSSCDLQGQKCCLSDVSSRCDVTRGTRRAYLWRVVSCFLDARQWACEQTPVMLKHGLEYCRRVVLGLADLLVLAVVSSYAFTEEPGPRSNTSILLSPQTHRFACTVPHFVDWSGLCPSLYIFSVDAVHKRRYWQTHPRNESPNI